MKKYILIASAILLLFSCGPILTTIYGVNKNQHFDSKQELTNYYVTKNKLDKERIYFFTSNDDREKFVENEIITKGKSEYYGIQLTDSTMVDDTDVERQWCMGVVSNVITDSALHRKVKQSNITNYKLVNIHGKPVSFNSGQPTVVFVINSNMGRLINKNLGYVVNEINKTKTDVNYIYIAADFLPEYKVAEK